MPEFRRNPVTGQWVVVAENRGGRPRDIALETVASPARSNCPFCEMHESQTTREVLARRRAGTEHDQPGWSVRVVRNKYPALTEEKAESRRQKADDDSMPAEGIHEVIIESPEHLTSITQLDGPHVREVLDVYRERLAELRKQCPGASAIIFKNNGAAAGATLAHLHSQLIVAPRAVTMNGERPARFRALAEQEGKCPLCSMIDEARQRDLVLAESAEVVAFCPFASRFSYETWVVPRRHLSDYDRIDGAALSELAELLRQTLVRIERAAGAAYNYVLHTSPFDTAPCDQYHWHIEILPRRAMLAGFELGTGWYINQVSPEIAAAQMRQL